jgi:hypothetical protein
MSLRGFSKARLDPMHDVMAGYVERGKAPGLVSLVSRHDQIAVDVIGTTKAARESSRGRRSS